MSSTSRTSSPWMGSSRSLAMRTIPGVSRPKLEMARKSIFTGMSIARAKAVRKKTDPFNTPTSFTSRPLNFSLISAATSRIRVFTCSSVNRTLSMGMLKYQILQIFLVKDLNINMRINRAQELDFPVFLGHQRLLHGGKLHIQIDLREIEIRCECL